MRCWQEEVPAGDSLKSNCSGKRAKQVAPSMDMKLFTWLLPEDGPAWEPEVPCDRNEPGDLFMMLWLYEMKIKIRAIYSRLFFLSYFNLLILRKWEKRSDSKTRGNRAGDFVDPLITLLCLCITIFQSPFYFFQEGREGPMRSSRDPSPITFYTPPSPPLHITIVNG